ncbi:hypothetical protein B0H19DRAFT_1069450 [Mycena capillaripes]|nr:hypothetical protein B0H19DRAFT_1069450 [Mycena capillaripes]
MNLQPPTFIFPPSNYAYVPPAQFYNGASHMPPPPGAFGGPDASQYYVATSQAPPSPDPFPPNLLNASSQPVRSPTRSPKPTKRRPGRPRINNTAPPSQKSPNKKKRGPGRPPKKPQDAAKKSAKVAQKKSDAKQHRDPGRKVEKENQAPNEIDSSPITIDDSDSESESEEGGRKQWTDSEKTAFFEWLLGPGDDYRFEQHKKNPAHVYKRASELLFSGKRSAKAIGSLWQRSLETFGYIVAFESFTGNGGGDADSDDPSAILKKLDAARTAGLPIGTLKPAVLETWENHGWRDLFTQRLGTSAKVSRDIVRNSASALSDRDDDDDESSDGDSMVDPTLRAQGSVSVRSVKTPASGKNPAATVSEPKHTPASKFRAQANNSLGNMGEYMKVKMLSEDKKAQMMDAKLDLDKAKLELEKQKVELDTQRGKVEMARTVLAMEGTTAEVKNACNTFLLSLFQQ